MPRRPRLQEKCKARHRLGTSAAHRETRQNRAQRRGHPAKRGLFSSVPLTPCLRCPAAATNAYLFSVLVAFKTVQQTPPGTARLFARIGRSAPPEGGPTARTVRPVDISNRPTFSAAVTPHFAI